jgi:hypothetical protein
MLIKGITVRIQPNKDLIGLPTELIGLIGFTGDLSS